MTIERTSTQLPYKRGVSHQMIGGLLTAAQQNKTIQGELKEEYGYTPEDFPSWWHQSDKPATAIEEAPPSPPGAISTYRGSPPLALNQLWVAIRSPLELWRELWKLWELLIHLKTAPLGDLESWLGQLDSIAQHSTAQHSTA